MYLIIDEQYRIYKSEVLSGKIRNLCKNEQRLSIVNLRTMQGLNADGTWEDIQGLPIPFDVDE